MGSQLGLQGLRLGEDPLEGGGVHGLKLQQVPGHQVQGGALLGEDVPAPGVGVVHQGLDLLVDDGGHLLGVGLGLCHGAADEDLVVAGVEGDAPQPGTHAVAHDHVPGNGAGPLDVVARPGGDVPQGELLGHPAAQQGGDALGELLPGLEVPVLLGQADGHATRPAPGHNGDLVDRVGGLQGVAHHGVACLVVGGELPLPLGHHPALLLGAGHHLDDGLVEVGHGEEGLLPPGGQQGGLVHQVL